MEGSVQLSTSAKGRARHEALFTFLVRHPMATTDRLTALTWGGVRACPGGRMGL